MRVLATVELIFIVALSIAFICSMVIAYHVYVHKDRHYRKGFSSWQMPMIFAILAEMYLVG
jgi:hypothetical protein